MLTSLYLSPISCTPHLPRQDCTSRGFVPQPWPRSAEHARGVDTEFDSKMTTQDMEEPSFPSLVDYLLSFAYYTPACRGSVCVPSDVDHIPGYGE